MPPALIAAALAAAAAPVVPAAPEWRFPQPQAYWTRRVAPALFSSGRPDRAQIALIRDAGFRSLVSLFKLPAVTEWNNMTGDFVDTDDYTAIGAALGLETRVFDFDSWSAPSSFNDFARAVDALPKPVLVHCHVGYAATAFSTLYAVRTGAAPGGEFYSRTVANGFDYATDARIGALWANVTGSADAPAARPASINLRLAGGSDGYTTYYWTRRVSDDWYVAGQPNLTHHVPSIVASGYGAVVSLRVDGEEDPYWPGGRYNASAQAAAFRAAGVQYFSAPVPSPITAAGLRAAGGVLADAAGRARGGGPVLCHCRTGYRAAAAVAAHAGGGWHAALRAADAAGFPFWASDGGDATVDAIRLAAVA